ncbi:MAG: hypothetical protein HWE08_03105 [Alphaproteobacteria bacterium]|nr:hypothetical protein [Alphaproteobacteria bacterium]
MMRFLSSVIFLVALLANTSMAQAQQLEELSRRAPYAGLYLSVPLGGTVEKPFTDRARFGFAAGYQQPLYGRAIDLTGRKQVAMKLVNLEFNQRGFDQFAVAGMPFVAKSTDGHLIFLADDEGDKKGGSGIGKALLIGAGVLAGIVVVAVVASCVEDGSDNDEESLNFDDAFCPVG